MKADSLEEIRLPERSSSRMDSAERYSLIKEATH